MVIPKKFILKQQTMECQKFQKAQLRQRRVIFKIKKGKIFGWFLNMRLCVSVVDAVYSRAKSKSATSRSRAHLRLAETGLTVNGTKVVLKSTLVAPPPPTVLIRVLDLPLGTTNAAITAALKALYGEDKVLFAKQDLLCPRVPSLEHVLDPTATARILADTPVVRTLPLEGYKVRIADDRKTVAKPVPATVLASNKKRSRNQQPKQAEQVPQPPQQAPQPPLQVPQPPRQAPLNAAWQSHLPQPTQGAPTQQQATQHVADASSQQQTLPTATDEDVILLASPGKPARPLLPSSDQPAVRATPREQAEDHLKGRKAEEKARITQSRQQRREGNFSKGRDLDALDALAGDPSQDTSC